MGLWLRLRAGEPGCGDYIPPIEAFLHQQNGESMRSCVWVEVQVVSLPLRNLHLAFLSSRGTPPRRVRRPRQRR